MIQQIGHAAGETSVAGTSFTIPLGAVQVGDAIIVNVAGGSADISSVTDNLGNTYTRLIAGNMGWNYYGAVYWCNASVAGSSTITVTMAASTDASGEAYSARGINTSLIGQFAGSFHGSSTAISLPTNYKTETTNSLVIGFVSQYAGGTITAGTGYSKYDNPIGSGNFRSNSLFATATSKGIQTPNGTLGTAGNWDGWVVCLREAPTRVPFEDDFSDTTLDMTRKWAGHGSNGSYNTSVFSIVSGQLQMALPAASATYHGIISGPIGETFNLTGKRLSIQVASIGASSTNATTEIYPLQTYQDAGSANNAWWYINGGNLSAFKKVAGTQTNVASLGAWSATTHKYLSIREGGGTLYWEYSSDGITWTVAHSEATPFTITAMVCELTIGAWDATGTGVTALLDNFNILPAGQTAAETLFDDFNDNSTSAAKWPNAYGSYSEASQEVTFNYTSGSSNYSGYKSTATAYDLTGSYIYAKVVSAGNQALASFQVIPVEADDATAANKLTWYVNNGNIHAQKVVGGTATDLASVAYNSATHKFFRIREKDGTTYWDYSTDGVTWTNLASAANPMTVSALSLITSAGAYASEASSTSGVIDNFNTLNSNAGGNSFFF